MNRAERFLSAVMRASSIILPVFTIFGINAGGIWSFTGFFFIFGIYLATELILAATGLGINSKASESGAEDALPTPTFSDRYGLHIFIVLHLTSFAGTLFVLSKTAFGIEWFGGILSLGIQAGSIGGLAGHEFLHSRVRLEKILGLMTYNAINYAHFEVSHLLGHHRFIGLESDWSTARSGESFYRFWYRAVVHGYIGAWRLEAENLRRKKIPLLSISNRPLIYGLFQVLTLASVFMLLNVQAVIAHLVISVVAWSQIEAINYMSHYGLTRKKDARGRLEKITPLHTWESNNKATNWFVFNTGKHSHHHTDQCAAHYELRLDHLGEYIPVGLPVMSLICLIPPLFFAIMNPQLKKRQELAERMSSSCQEGQLQQV